MGETRIFLNTWRAYNDGSIGYGWMTATEAREFIEENPERDGGEWFVADIDNYLGVKFDSLDYCDVAEIIGTIEQLEELEGWERDEVVALMEYLGTDDATEALSKKDSFIFYSDIDSYYDCMDDLIGMELASVPESISRYFDYEQYHQDCSYDICEMSNGVVIAA